MSCAAAAESHGCRPPRLSASPTTGRLTCPCSRNSGWASSPWRGTLKWSASSSRRRRSRRRRSSTFPTTYPRTVLECCGCGSRRGRRGRSLLGRCNWPAGDGRPARCAGCPSMPRGTSARGRTGTGSAMPEPLQRGRGPRQRQRRRVGRVGPVGPADAAGPGAAEADVSPASLPDGDAAALDMLAKGSLEVEGRLVVASNATLYCTVRDTGRAAACVYKPVAGERPLWDFPAGSLAGREVAAYQVSTAAGWHLVPPTVYRDGPFGPGMCQLWIEPDETVDVIALARSDDHHALREMAVFDAGVNNADRKIAHL